VYATLPVIQKADLILVRKSDRVMQMLKNGNIIREYQIALGFSPIGDKYQEGDGRTPEGVYKIDARNPNSKFTKSLRISYPSEADIARAKRAGNDPGGDIMIHGLPTGVTEEARLQHPTKDWTEGCIAVNNEEIAEIWQMVDDGTTIVIMP
jgi:murein L,D-transpeptidase YafK